MSKGTEVTVPADCRDLRVLSYNLSIPPIGYSAYQHERIDTFVSLVDGYDVLLLQEVYPSSVVPYALQHVLCSQSRLLDKLRSKGFYYYVISRQPSYKTMVQYKILSNSGLVIASRYPIFRHGSYTFRNAVQQEGFATTHGCLFAEIEVPSQGGKDHPSVGGSRVVLFNVHLNPAQSHFRRPTTFHVHEAHQFVDYVMHQLSEEGDPGRDIVEGKLKGKWLPFVVAGDFNISGVDSISMKPSSDFNLLLQEFDLLGDMQNVLFDSDAKMTSIPVTRPPQLFFSKEPALEEIDATPDRQDYFFVSKNVNIVHESLEKFVVGRRPYVYLSDHYGIAVTLRAPLNVDESSSKGSRARLYLSSLVEEAVSEATMPTRGIYYFTFTMFLAFAIFSYCVSWRFLFYITLLLAIVARVVWSTLTPLPPSVPFATVTDKVIAGESCVEVSKANELDSLTYDDTTLASAWNRAANRFVRRPCVLARGDTSSVFSLSYSVVNERSKLFARGLMSLGLMPGDRIGVQCDACRDAVLLDVVCLKYGYATVSLSGRGASIRSVLDHHHIRVVCSTPSNIYTLLNCRSTALETIICLDGFPSEADMSVAKDLNITIMSSTSIREQGRMSTQDVPVVSDGSMVWTYSMNNIATSNFSELTPVTHSDALRDLKALQVSGVLPRNSVVYRGETDSFVWYFPFDSLFPRVCMLGVLFTGGSIITADPSNLEEVCKRAQPSFFLAPPALFRLSLRQMKRTLLTKKTWKRWLTYRVYSFFSWLIHSHNTDCAALREFFAGSLRHQLGGNVKKIILYTTEESTAFNLLEYITICYVPHVREVFFLNHIGVCGVDGIPAPNIRVRLEPLDDLSAASSIGRLCITRSGEPEVRLDIAATWEKHRTLTLLDTVEGILWPVDYHYAVAVELERMFKLSRHVNDAFVYCEPRQSLIVVVHPNKDTLEFAWRQTIGTTTEQQFGWKELVAFGCDVILEDLRSIGKRHHLHHSQIPRFIHLHPHAFNDHANFVNPFGKRCRPKMISYFKSFFVKIYSSSPCSPASPREPPFQDFSSDTDQCENNHKSIGMMVPLTVDIGGTFAKIAYIMPPGMAETRLPEMITREASSLTKTLGVRVFHFFKHPEEAEKELQENPSSPVGTIRFMKVPTTRVVDLAEMGKRVNALGLFKDEFTKSIRATGGGAFKYAHVAEQMLGAKFNVVKEMDAVVKGLNLVLHMAPSSIFTVNHETGERVPHKLQSPGATFSPFPYLLINIGSGISFIKCTSADGSHVRVGGSPIGGATFWGLTRSLTNLTSWEEVLEIMRLDGPGDNKNVDLLVGDIYGYNAKDLPAMLSCETVASSFGKLGVESAHASQRVHSRNNSISDADSIASMVVDNTGEKNSIPGGSAIFTTPANSSMDVVRSLLNLLSGNVTQLAYLHSRLHGVKNIFFVGGFVRENQILHSHISQAMQYWSSGECYAHFLEHDGYLGALGCTVIDSPPASSET